MTTIPASAIVNVQPNVLSAGGRGLVLNGTILTLSTQVPIGVMQPFASALDVGDYFGLSSTQKALADRYFAGFTNSNVRPGNLYFTQYPQDAVAAYLRGGDVTTLTLAELGALTGSLTIIMDGYTHAAASVNLAGSTSYSNAASIINTAINATEPTEATATGAISGVTMTLSAVGSGTVAVGQTVTGSGVAANTIITALGTGSGGTGTYIVNNSQTVSSEALTMKATAIVVSFDSVSGGFVATSGITGTPSTAAFATGTLAASIFMTQATGAVVSQGAGATNPSAFMTGLTQLTQNWATFMTDFDPDNGSGNAVKEAFAAWNGLQNNRWAYICWDTDVSPTNTVPATTSLGYLLQQQAIGGTCLIWDPTDGTAEAAFILGTVASIDFSQFNGRTDIAFRAQSGLAATVTDQTTGNNLMANGYNFYGAYATANQQFLFFYNGSVSGPFSWLDSYVNQVWFNAALQLALMLLLTQVKAVPFNAQGYALVEAAVADPIAAARNFGAFSPGVQLSELQQAEVNNAAGRDITATLFAQGYYFQVTPATAQVRGLRGPLSCTLWYTDAGAVQSINLASIAIQ